MLSGRNRSSMRLEGLLEGGLPRLQHPHLATCLWLPLTANHVRPHPRVYRHFPRRLARAPARAPATLSPHLDPRPRLETDDNRGTIQFARRRRSERLNVMMRTTNCLTMRLSGMFPFLRDLHRIGLRLPRPLVVHHRACIAQLTAGLHPYDHQRPLRQYQGAVSLLGPHPQILSIRRTSRRLRTSFASQQILGRLPTRAWMRTQRRSQKHWRNIRQKSKARRSLNANSQAFRGPVQPRSPNLNLEQSHCHHFARATLLSTLFSLQ